jgi:hypothetical protein
MSKMSKKQFNEAICYLVNCSSETLMHHLLEPSSKKLNESFQVKSYDELIKVCKSVLIHFYKVWYQEVHDFELMSTLFFNKHLDIDENTFIDGVIHTALEIEDYQKWDRKKYPIIFFEDNDYQKPFSIKIQID